MIKLIHNKLLFSSLFINFVFLSFITSVFSQDLSINILKEHQLQLGFTFFLLLLVIILSFFLIYILRLNVKLKKSRSALLYEEKQKQLYKDEITLNGSHIRNLLNAIPYAVLGFKNDKITFSNLAVKSLFGWSPEDLIGQPASILLCDEETKLFGDDFQRILSKRGNVSLEIKAIKKNHKIFDSYFSISMVAQNDEKQESVGVFMDISDRKEKEFQIQKLSRAIEQGPVGVVILSIEGVIEYANSKFFEVMSYPLTHIIGKHLVELLLDRIPKNSVEEFMHALSSGNRWEGEVKTFNNNDLSKGDSWLFITASPIKDQLGHIMNYVLLIENMTERKKVQIDLLESQEELTKVNKSLIEKQQALTTMLSDLDVTHKQLKSTQAQLVQSEKMASIGQLAAGIAHEINNPVAFISTNMVSLKRYLNEIREIYRIWTDFSQFSVPYHEEDLEKLKTELAYLKDRIDIDFAFSDINEIMTETQEGLDRIKNIVLDLKTFSRRTDGIPFVRSNVNDIINGVINIVWNEIKYKVKLSKQLSEVPDILCNPQQLGQVFINIIINAWQAVDQDGLITVKTYLNEKNYVCIDISDNGCGISASNKDKIFEPFFTTKKTGEGTGLGLSISCDIVNKHNGNISFKSLIGQGTTFTVMLPPANTE